MLTTVEEARWKAIQERDPGKDGEFFYGVVTTGVYCRPSCSSRQPKLENTRFYDSAELAVADGLRPCKRCKPDQNRQASDPAVNAVRDVCRYLKTNSTDNPNLQQLAARAGLSLAHFHRTFKRLVGVTPKEYIDKLRFDALKTGLKKSGSVTESVYASGFGSSSRVYERSQTRLGMTPAQYSKGGEGVTITHVAVDSPLGRMMLGATDRGICFLQFGEDDGELLSQLRQEFPQAVQEPMQLPGHPDFARWITSLEEYLAGLNQHLAIPVDVRATAFQLQVWNYLHSIPYGEVRSYSEVAEQLGRPRAVRAVANACASNAVALLIPCHRVLRNNGDLGGYRWGMHRKRTLLDLERAGRARAASAQAKQLHGK